MSNIWTERKRNCDESYPRKPFNSETDDSQYQRDRARIIHSASFRRLQSKTQVLNLGESDFYRTRLTHSLEVAQIGSSICEHLKEIYKEKKEYLEWIPSLSLIEAICLGHDLGHPPFGHGGERALNSFMKDHGGFEGNGQTLRISSRLGEYSPNHGFDLTRRTILGLLKYPAIHQEVSKYSTSPSISSTNIDHAEPPKCIHDDELDVLDWIISPFSDSDRQLFRSYEGKEGAHSKTIYKSLDTSIMELADDIAYGVHDLEDAIALELVTIKQWIDGVASKISGLDTCDLNNRMDFYKPNLFSGSSKERKHAISKLVGYFVQSIQISEISSFDSPLLRLQAKMEPQAEKCLKILKSFVFNDVIRTPQVQALEFKGQHMILRLFKVLQENPKRLLQKSDQDRYEQSPNKNRIICDYIAGMTDVYATRLYNRLFSPDIGSVFDRL